MVALWLWSLSRFTTARVSIPAALSQPVLGALSIFAFRSAGNDFLWPLPLLLVFLLANRRIIEGVRVGGLKS